MKMITPFAVILLWFTGCRSEVPENASSNEEIHGEESSGLQEPAAEDQGKYRTEKERAITNNRMKMFGLEFHNFHDANSKFPNRIDFVAWESSPDNLVDENLLSDMEQRCVILWDAFPESFMHLLNNENSESMLVAYEKNAQDLGGFGLFLDGAVKELSSEQITQKLENTPDRRTRPKREAEADFEGSDFE